MVLGFIPRFNAKLEDIRNARLGLNGDRRASGKKERFKNGINDLSALITYSLESSIITSDSMQARGYNPHAVRYSRYKMTASDIILTAFTLFVFIYVMYAKISGRITFVMNPEIYLKTFDISAMVLCCALFFLPTAVDLFEEIKWKISALKK